MTTGDPLTSCGTDNAVLTDFELCPAWLEWANWGTCQASYQVPVVDADDPDLHFFVFERTRSRLCNTGVEEDCLTTPGLDTTVDVTELCGKVQREIIEIPFDPTIFNADFKPPAAALVEKSWKTNEHSFWLNV